MVEEVSLRVEPWVGSEGIEIPKSVRDYKALLPLALDLSPHQRVKIIKAFEFEAFDMASEYVWKKALVKLRETLGNVGMKFIGEMIGREDVDDATPIESVVTDHLAIELAEQLGIIGATAALKLRQSNELINHYFSRRSEEEIDYHDALGIVKNCIQYVLGKPHIDIAVQFSAFRDRLLGETLKFDDFQVELIKNSPPFYQRTVLSVLLYAIKNEKGAKQEHSIANLNLLIESFWGKISDSDKWNLGSAYRDNISSGNTQAASGIRAALSKVNGFDFVPENLRSSTFIEAAKHLLDVHFSFNNFYNEPAAIKKLSSLGTVIPSPALMPCMQAYLAVFLGNGFGVSSTAAPIAEDELSKISPERWRYYFSHIIHTDDVVLRKMGIDQVARFARLLKRNNLIALDGLPRTSKGLYDAIVANDARKALNLSKALLNRFRHGSGRIRQV